MMLDYFYGQSGELFAYFRIPKALFQDGRFRQLSTDARTLYGILLDRMSLSAKNSWVDEHGRVYIIYTVREVQESLCCAEHKAVKLFRELEQADLIERKRRGLGRPSLIYVKNFSSGLPKAQIHRCDRLRDIILHIQHAHGAAASHAQLHQRIGAFGQRRSGKGEHHASGQRRRYCTPDKFALFHGITSFFPLAFLRGGVCITVF